MALIILNSLKNTEHNRLKTFHQINFYFFYFFLFLFFPKNLYRQLTTIVNKNIKYVQATDVSEKKIQRKEKENQRTSAI